jgi:uncharacterized protein
MTLHKKIHTDMQKALKERDTLTLSVLRGLLTSAMQECTKTGRTPKDTLSDEEMTSLIKRSIKQRNDSKEQYEKGGRNDLADIEEKEKHILLTYAPKEMDTYSIKEVLLRIQKEHSFTEKKDFGKLMSLAMKEIGHSADGKNVKKEALSLLS